MDFFERIYTMDMVAIEGFMSTAMRIINRIRRKMKGGAQNVEP